jgi:hypothetical protein
MVGVHRDTHWPIVFENTFLPLLAMSMEHILGLEKEN